MIYNFFLHYYHNNNNNNNNNNCLLICITTYKNQVMIVSTLCDIVGFVWG